MPGSRVEDGATAGSTIGARLRVARARRFAGRRAELELFEQALDDPATGWGVLFVHGPPGVGKSALLRQLEGVAAGRGRPVSFVDLRGVELTPEGFHTALKASAPRGRPEADVILLDTYELASALDGWIREVFIPGLPAETLVVIAGRLPPSPAWVSDPGWRELVRVIGLRNLRREDAEGLLVAEGLDPAQRQQVLEETLGHPLALALYVDLLSQRTRRSGADRGQVGLLDAPDAVRVLLARFVEEVPTPAHRAALEVCAHVAYTTEALLRVALEASPPDAAILFDWLRGLSFVETADRGVFPHDLARDVIDSDLRWRDAAAYEALHRRVRRHFIDNVRAAPPGERHRAATDLVFLHRSNLLMRPFWDFSGMAQGYVDHLRPGDHDALRTMVAAHEGAESAGILDHWLDRQPEGFAVVRVGADPAPQGFTALIALHEASADDLAADPGARAMWQHARHQAGEPAGRAVVACRFIVDRDSHQTPGSMVFGLTAVNHLQHMLIHRDRAMDYIGGISIPEQLEPLFTYIEFLAAPDASYTSDGRTWTVFARDWRRLGVDDWFELVADRELGAPVEREDPGSAMAAIALSQPDFAAAVRAALRDLQRPEQLRSNPLLRSRLVDAATGRPAPPEALAAVVRDAVEAIGADPRNEKYHRALDRTFLRPAPTQERAAEVLGLPFSTYRRHLVRGLELVTAALWDRELYGASAGPR